ncbi:MAG: hypothetical protein AMXMBFR83_11460 [Phycisphaerae bacterium]
MPAWRAAWTRASNSLFCTIFLDISGLQDGPKKGAVRFLGVADRIDRQELSAFAEVPLHSEKPEKPVRVCRRSSVHRTVCNPGIEKMD